MAGKSTYVGSLSPEYALLGLLAGGGAHGYELHQKLSTDLGQIWHVSLSQTYNILNRLEEKGYINGEMQVQEKLPPRRTFRLTPSGEERFENWLHSVNAVSVKAIRLGFITRLYFAQSIDPNLAQEILAIQIKEIRKGVERLERIAEGFQSNEFNWLAINLRVNQLNTILSWLDECKSFLKNLTKGDRN